MSGISVFDRRHLRLQRLRSVKKFHGHSFLFDWCADQLADRLQDIKRSFPTALGIGNRVPQKFWQDLSKSKQIDHLQVCDLIKGNVIADSEFLPFKDNSADLVISALDLHSVNDLPGTLVQIKKILKPDGLFIACLLGGETLFELRDSLMQTEMTVSSGASPRVAPFADTKQMGELLSRAGFALPVVDSEIIRVSYQSVFNLMADLRGMGESNSLTGRQKNFTSPRFFAHAAEYYQSHYPDRDNRVTASFEVIFLIGWSPHASQQQPLRRGSATHSMTEFLQ